MNKNTHSNPFMRKHTEVKQEDDRWANLEIKEEPKKNRFQSEKNTDDAFRNKGNSFSKCLQRSWLISIAVSEPPVLYHLQPIAPINIPVPALGSKTCSPSLISAYCAIFPAISFDVGYN